MANMFFRQKEAEQQKQKEKKTEKPQAIVVMKPDEEAKYIKLLRQPRSRKFMKSLKDVDILSEDDEALIERLRQTIEEETGTPVPPDYVFGTQELDAFRQSVEAQIAKNVKEEIEREAKRMGDIIEANKKPSLIISPCAIKGCIVHSLFPDGSINTHYPPVNVAMQDFPFRKAAEIVTSRSEWTSVEIFPTKLVHRGGSGDVIKIYNLEE